MGSIFGPLFPKFRAISETQKSETSLCGTKNHPNEFSQFLVARGEKSANSLKSDPSSGQSLEPPGTDTKEFYVNLGIIAKKGIADALLYTANSNANLPSTSASNATPSRSYGTLLYLRTYCKYGARSCKIWVLAHIEAKPPAAAAAAAAMAIRRGSSGSSSSGSRRQWRFDVGGWRFDVAGENPARLGYRDHARGGAAAGGWASFETNKTRQRSTIKPVYEPEAIIDGAHFSCTYFWSSTTRKKRQRSRLETFPE